MEVPREPARDRLLPKTPSQTHSWLWPENYEMIWGIPAVDHVFGLLFWKAGPDSSRRRSRARTAGVQAQLDDAAADKAAAEAEAAEIRQAQGDIDAERARLLAEADEQAVALNRDGAARLEAEIAELEAKADADIAAAASRVVDELRAEIARLSAAAAEHVVNGRSTTRPISDLIEGFIAEGRRHARGHAMSDARIEGYARGAVRDRPRRRHPRRGRGRAVPLRPQPREQRPAAQRAHRRADPGEHAARRSSRTCSAARPRAPPRS